MGASWASPALGDEASLDAKLAVLPKPWIERMHRLTVAEYEATLRFWEQRHGDRLKVERVGESREGLGIYLLKITDGSVPDADKQIALVTALHGGPERSGSNAVLALAEELLGESDEAKRTRRRQVVLLMPINNPTSFFHTDRFGNAFKIDPYNTSAHWDLSALAFRHPDQAPEVMAVLKVVDRFQPEVHVDCHGTGLQEFGDNQLGDRTGYQGQIMTEITGSAYSNYSLRPWDWRITESMIAAGREAGFPSDRFEADAQRCLAGPMMDPVAGRFWIGRPLFYTAHHGYARYHTMISAIEVGWEQSGVARVMGLLKMGNQEPRTGEPGGYPVNRIKSLVGHFITADGATASERRASRTALWGRQSAFSQAMLYPQTDGRDSYIVATSAAGDALLDSDPQKFLVNLAHQPGIDAGAIATFIKHGPEMKLVIDRGKPEAKPENVAPLPGFSLLLRLPYQEPKIADLRLNGREIRLMDPNGVRTYTADGFRHIEVRVSREEAASHGIFIVTCAYIPDQARRTGWTPPKEAIEAAKKTRPQR